MNALIQRLRARPSGWVVLLLLVAAGCATPIYTVRVPSTRTYRQTTASALDGDQCSSATSLVLWRYNMADSFGKDPEGTLRQLHAIAVRDDRRDVLYALAELNYLEARRVERQIKPWAAKNAPDYYLSSAVYAYFYLFGDTNGAAARPLDPRTRVAADLYNYALAKGLTPAASTNGALRFAAGPRQLPAGRIELSMDLSQFPMELGDFTAFLPTSDYLVRGLAVRNMDNGMGSPLMGVLKVMPPNTTSQRVPATVFLRVRGSFADWAAGGLGGSVELYSTFDQLTLDIGGFRVPLQTDTTTPLAAQCGDMSIWDLDFARFFSTRETIRSGIHPVQPYRRGRVPVVFVHGTASSPIWWGEMLNMLRADPVLREHFQFWVYAYNTGLPITYSAASFRDALTNAVFTLDPGGTDAALRQMVVIGHSQGGLLTKIVATDPGDRLWLALAATNREAVTMTPAQRQLVDRSIFFTPAPSVTRVVFMCTPHRGSFLATSFVRRLVSRFMSFPSQIAQATQDLLQLQTQLRLPVEFRSQIPSSIDSMSPNNRFLLALADIPPATNVVAHSIIAVTDPAAIPNANDGVVAYKSAHVTYVESEFIVNSNHSCQNKPPVVEEVRRILLEHLKSLPAQAR